MTDSEDRASTGGGAGAAGVDQLSARNRQVMALRDVTGAGLLDCRNALAAAGWDFDAAKAAIRAETLRSMRRFGGIW